MSRFARAMTVLAVHEGGWSNHPKDPGGATMKGVTQRTYDAYRRRQNLKTRSVRNITDSEVSTIYRHQYWDAVRGSELPHGLAYCVFDAAVNSGPARAAKWLQEILGVAVDGIIGTRTLDALAGRDITQVIDAFCNRRLAFMRRLKTWDTFKNGWSKRVAEVRVQSKRWAKGYVAPASGVEVQPKADGDVKVSATIKDMATNPGALGGVAGILGSVGTLAGGDGPVQYALAGVLVVAALTGVWWLVKRKNA